LFVPDLWRFGKLVIDYIRIYKEVPTRRVILEKVAKQNNKNLLEHITEVFNKIDVVQYNDIEYKHDLEKFKNRFAEKLIVGLKDNLTNQVGNIDLKKSMGEIQSVLGNIKGINQVKAYEQKTLRDAADEFKDRYVARLRDPNFGIGTLTGYSFFDFITGGLRPSEMLLIGADTGGGKSIMLMNIAINMWLAGNNIEMEKNFKEGVDILFFSLEMPFLDMQERVLSRLAMIPQVGIRDAKLTDEEQKRLSKALKFTKRYPFDFEIVDMPRGATIESIEMIYNDIASSRRKPAVVVIDYLSLMEHSRKDEIDDWLKLGEIAGSVSEFGRVNEVITLSAVQLNDPGKGNKTGESQIGMHRIGRSKLILHHANFALQIEKRPNEESFPELNLHMIKHRRTQGGKGKVYKNLSCCALLNDPLENNDQNKDPGDISNRIV